MRSQRAFVAGQPLCYRSGPLQRWRRGGVVTQRSAKPRTPVQFRASPPFNSSLVPAGVIFVQIHAQGKPTVPRPHNFNRNLRLLTSSPAGVAGGFIFLAASVSLLWWNEDRNVQADRALGEASMAVSTAPELAEPGNDGRLVHVIGEVHVTLPVQDSDLDLVFDGTLAVARTVEMFQWIETAVAPSESLQKPLQPATYKLGWSSDWQDSSSFDDPETHANPKLQLTSQNWTASDAKLGAFTLNEAALANLEAVTPLTPATTPAGWTKFGTDFYLSLNPARPTLGDLRVRYAVLKAPAQISILAQQTGLGLTPYKLRNGDDLFVVQLGAQSADQLFDSQKHIDSTLTWVLRGAGMLLLWMAFIFIVGSMKSRAPALSFPGRWPAVSSASAAFVLTLPLGLSTIAMAWLFYRPLMAAPLMMTGLAGAFIFAKCIEIMAQRRREPDGALGLTT